MSNPILLVDPDGMKVVTNSQLAVDDLNALLVDNKGQQHNIFYFDNGILNVRLSDFSRLLQSDCSDDVKYIACAATYLILIDQQVGLYYTEVHNSQLDKQPEGISLYEGISDNIYDRRNAYEAWTLSTIGDNKRREVSCHEFLGHVFYWAAVNSSFPPLMHDGKNLDQAPNIANATHAVSISNLVRRIQNGGYDNPRTENHEFIDDIKKLPQWDMRDYNIIRQMIEDNVEYKWRMRPKSSGSSKKIWVHGDTAIKNDEKTNKNKHGKGTYGRDAYKKRYHCR